MKKVLLIYSGEKSRMPRLPLPCLVLASYLRKQGYTPEVLDLRLHDFKGFEEKPICIGISSMTGADLKLGIETAKKIKKEYPDIPIIWGGHHVSALPEQSIKEDYIDAIIVGEGELTLLKIIRLIESNRFKKGIYSQEIIDMKEMDIPSYDLVDVKKYLDGNDEFSFETSRGCPHRCRFCYIHYFHHQKWRTKTAKQIVKEIGYVINKYGIKKIKIIGDNFFVDKKLVMDVCKQITPLKLEWCSTCRVDYIANFTDEELQTLKDSGCWMLQMGVESGSEEILKYMQKDITIEQSIKAVKRCVKYRIAPFISLIIGLPKENIHQMKQTLDIYDKLDALGGMINGIVIYGPYPGTPMYKDAIDAGYLPPESLEKWCNIQLKRESQNWHGKLGPQMETIVRISRFKFFLKQIKNIPKEMLIKKIGLSYSMIMLGIIPFRILGYLRWKYRFFKCGYDFKLFFKIMSKFTDIY